MQIPVRQRKNPILLCMPSTTFFLFPDSKNTDSDSGGRQKRKRRDWEAVPGYGCFRNLNLVKIQHLRNFCRFRSLRRRCGRGGANPVLGLRDLGIKKCKNIFIWAFPERFCQVIALGPISRDIQACRRRFFSFSTVTDSTWTKRVSALILKLKRIGYRFSADAVNCGKFQVLFYRKGLRGSFLVVTSTETNPLTVICISIFRPDGICGAEVDSISITKIGDSNFCRGNTNGSCTAFHIRLPSGQECSLISRIKNHSIFVWLPPCGDGEQKRHT